MRSVKLKEGEAPVELVIRIQGLVEKWREIVKEQFIDTLSKVWVKERKPVSSKEAGQLAEDYRRQARKISLRETCGTL